MVMKSDIHTLLENGPEPAAQLASLETAPPPLRPAGHARLRDDANLEVVWSGVGQLPGAGGAAGLGSTLSGIHFSIGRRG